MINNSTYETEESGMSDNVVAVEGVLSQESQAQMVEAIKSSLENGKDLVLTCIGHEFEENYGWFVFECMNEIGIKEELEPERYREMYDKMFVDLFCRWVTGQPPKSCPYIPQHIKEQLLD